ncbi:MAG: NAD(P)H-dependent oxidoreductase [Betaproteobacteria bacterium]|jgi:glutathione-regulated potassium-efflux system ancillary protein KefG|nr:NAD(P)H-dependent oxidoreductase [Betaproteobacteria bacterium]
MSTLRVLVLYAHPNHDMSRTNRVLRAAIEGLAGVTVHDLYDCYPHLFVDVRREQRLLLEHDVLVFQHPMQWYSAPAIVKEWEDSVLENGWAYGEGGDKLRGKHFMQAVSTGGHSESYRHGGKAHFTIPELLRPFEQMAHYCGMVYLPPFVTHDARDTADSEIATQAVRYRALLEAIHRGDVPAPFHTIPAED